MRYLPLTDQDRKEMLAREHLFAVLICQWEVAHGMAPVSCLLKGVAEGFVSGCVHQAI